MNQSNRAQSRRNSGNAPAESECSAKEGDLEVSADCSSNKLAVIVGSSSVNCSFAAGRDGTGATGVEGSEFDGVTQQQQPPHVIGTPP
ncbi:MAG TPA: hypothetical protein VI282_18335 [Verrucomicrobiae bacterium]|jgi:hypothetical protein